MYDIYHLSLDRSIEIARSIVAHLPSFLHVQFHHFHFHKRSKLPIDRSIHKLKLNLTKMKQTPMHNMVLLCTASIAALSCTTTAQTLIVQYNNPASNTWPGTGEWLKLSRSLSSDAELYGPFESSDYEEQCGPDEIDITDPFIVATAGEGLCMQYPSCANEFCLEDKGTAYDDLPAYAIMAKTEEDIVAGLEFANSHNIQVTVKTSGHSISGASTAKDSLLIWLAQYPEDNTITEEYVDSCEDTNATTNYTVIGVNAGQNFNSIASAVGDDYHFVSASEGTVGASGGWILGGGLSYTSREYGLGVDNVLAFRVVLANGIVSVADRCSNSDLFWALRGGGGGTFGVITHMIYKLHPKRPIVRFQFDLGDLAQNDADVSKFLKYWVETSPSLDSRWGGSFSWFGLDLFFVGNLVGANFSFLDAFLDWVETELDPEGTLQRDEGYTTEYASWSKVLLDLSDSELSGQDYITPETSFSRLIPQDFAKNQAIKTYQLLESLANSDNMGYTNLLLGKNINDVRDDATSVNPAMRDSVFLITANRYGYEKMVTMLPNNVTGVSKNHHGGLEPEWRQAIWGDNYPRLLAIKKLVDPTQVFNCYQSVGYGGKEVDVYNYMDATATEAPTPSPKGTIPGQSPTSAASFFGARVATGVAAVSVYLLR